MFEIATIVALVVAVLAMVVARSGSVARPAGERAVQVRFPRLDWLTAFAVGITFLGLVLTGFFDIFVMHRIMQGWVLLAHVGFGSVFAVALLLFAFFRAETNAPAPDGPVYVPGWQKVFFWLFVVSGLALLLTAILAMVPWLGTDGQGRIIVMHRWISLLSLISALGYVGVAGRRRRVIASGAGREIHSLPAAAGGAPLTLAAAPSLTGGGTPPVRTQGSASDPSRRKSGPPSRRKR